MKCLIASWRKLPLHYLRGLRNAWNADRQLAMQLLMTLLCVGLVIACASGCTRTVLVAEASPIRVGPDCHARVYTFVENEWRLSSNLLVIPEGWYCVPPSYITGDVKDGNP